MTPDALRALFAGAGLPDSLSWAVAPAVDAALFPEEEAFIACAVPARKAEFAGGRVAARAALAGLGLPVMALPPDARRIPIWPAGTLGSISHAEGLCAALSGRREDWLGLGLDIERDAPLDADLLSEICLPEELEGLDTAAARWRARQVFSAKEAVYKAQSGLTGTLFGFHGLCLAWDSGVATYTETAETRAVPGRWKKAELPFRQFHGAGIILSVCAIPA